MYPPFVNLLLPQWSLFQPLWNSAARVIGTANLNSTTDPIDSDQDLERRLRALIDSISPFGLALLTATFVFGIVFITLVRYALYDVVITLAMVENWNTTDVVGEQHERYTDDERPAEEAIGDETIVVLQAPITSKIRTTIRHLQTRAGRLAPFRGFSASIAYGFCYNIISNLFRGLLQPLELHRGHVDIPLVDIVASILGLLVVSNLGMLWTHIVISEPSPKYWFQRGTDGKSWRKILAPTFYTACAWQLVLALPMVIAQTLGLMNTHIDEHNAGRTMLKALGILGIALVCIIFVCLPAEVALRRVQASMLSLQDEPIVPFDRSFSGAVVPESMGGAGKLGYLDAWKSCDGATKLRLVKLYAKSFGIEVLLYALFMLCLTVEFVLFSRPEGKKHDGYGDHW